ncbi:hypothetical protein BN1723_017337, partial [Verticillium longisporum]
MEVTSQFLYRGVYADFENTFQRKAETPVQLHLATTQDVAVLKAKEWFNLDDLPQDIQLLGQTLEFRLQSFLKFQNKTVFSSIQTYGQGNVDIFGWETWEEKMAKWLFNGDDRNTKKVWVRGRLVHDRSPA